ncbi:MAG: beta-phosphoglucomutase [Schleiferiaceae bacterium]|nr:beta-phosphoglucomutase [Schleiferiaceae bacterium]
MKVAAFLFDLDGVLVDTAKYHFLAWRKMANALGFDFTHEQNEQLKGVGRVQSLEIILGWGGKTLSQEEKNHWMHQKNAWYQTFIADMNPDEILPGALAFLEKTKALGLKIALGSASRNAPVILEKTGLRHWFEAVVDGNVVSASKPNPEVYLKGAELLEVAPTACVVFEDAVSGMEAAQNAGMPCVGIGNADQLSNTIITVKGLHQITPEAIITLVKS